MQFGKGGKPMKVSIKAQGENNYLTKKCPLDDLNHVCVTLCVSN